MAAKNAAVMEHCVKIFRTEECEEGALVFVLEVTQDRRYYSQTETSPEGSDHYGKGKEKLSYGKMEND